MLKTYTYMKSIMLFLACSIAILAISCQKNKQTPPAEPPVSHETVKVKLKLTGDILTSETNLPLGRNAGDILPGARNFGNNTLYAVSVRIGNEFYPISTGLFDHPDSVYINVPVSGEFNVTVAIFKKGTGSGLFYTIQNGLKYFENPFSTALKNRMDSVTGYPFMYDSANYVRLADPLDSSNFLPDHYYPEMDYYWGSTSFTGSPSPTPLSLNIKRRSFGIQLSATNFTSGKLTTKLTWGSSDSYPVALPFSVTPANINSQYHIFAADDLRSVDSTYRINASVTWEKPDGSTVLIGEKEIYFKRNVLTKLNVTIPNTGRTSLGVTITETTWSGNETVDL